MPQTMHILHFVYTNALFQIYYRFSDFLFINISIDSINIDNSISQYVIH